MLTAENAIKFIEMLKHSKGECAGKRLILEPWQKRYIRELFGTYNDDGSRQYRTSLLEIPRKNGKSTLAAGIALLLLTADGEAGAEVYSAAGDRAQASIVFNEACNMIKQCPALDSICKIKKSSKLIEVPKTNSIYKALSAESFTKHGLNASGIIFDELHTQPDRDLWDVLTTSTGSRRQPLTLAITTAGFDRHSICYEIYSRAKEIAAGRLIDPTFLSRIFEADSKDDWRLESTWQKANPNYGISVRKEYLRAEAKKAEESPTYLNTFLRLHLNIWTDSDVRWLAPDKWELCAGDPDTLKSLKGRPCYGGLDLSSVSDITAFAKVFGLDDGRVAVVLRFWVPKERAHRRERVDGVPYETWERQGWITFTEGNVTDYDKIRADINTDAQEYQIKEIAVDRWNATQLTNQLSQDGFNMVAFGQGFASMAAPTKELEKLVLSCRLVHGGNPVLTWMSGNAVAEIDAAGNVKLSKARSTEKIDGMIAAIMGLARLNAAPKESNYDELLEAMGGKWVL